MAFATIGTAGIQAQSIDLSTKVTGTLPVPNGGIGIASGTTDQFLKFTGTETLASAADNAGTLVQTGSSFFTSSPSTGIIQITNCFTTDYDFYQIHFYCLPSSNADDLRVRYMNSSGEQNGNKYRYANKYFDNHGGVGSRTSGDFDTKIVLVGSISSSETMAGITGVMNVRLDPSNGSAGAFAYSSIFSVETNTSSGRLQSYYGGGRYQNINSSSGTATGIKFFLGNGNFAQANIKVYGLKGSTS